LDVPYRNGERPLDTLVERLGDELPRGSLVLAPAALGVHADHWLARAAALELRRRGTNVALYADVPHATSFGWPTAITGERAHSELRAEVTWEEAMRGTGISLATLEPEIAVLSDAERAAKLAAVRCYRTQLAALEAGFSILSRPEVLGHEVIWPLP